MKENKIEKTQIKEGEKIESFKDDHEHVVDIESPEIKEKINESRELFNSFLKNIKMSLI